MRYETSDSCRLIQFLSPECSMISLCALALSSAIILIDWSTPVASRAQDSPGTILVGKQTDARKDAASRREKRHRLVRRPATQTTNGNGPVLATATQQPPLGSTTATIQADLPASAPSTVRDEVLAKKSGFTPSGASVLTFAMPATASPVISATVTPSNATPSNGNSSPAVANAGGPGASRNRGRSAQHLVSETPRLTQLMTTPAPQTPVSPPSPPPTPPAIGASPMTVSFTASQGGNSPSTQSLSISNTGGGTLTWSAIDNASWLSVSPATGSGNGMITLTAATGSLTTGTHSAMITLNATGASPVAIPVTLTITAAPVPPSIGMSPTSLSFSAQQGGGNPAAQTINVSNTGGGTLSWSASDNAAWLNLSPATGTGNGTITLTVATGGLSAGSYNAVVTLSGGAGTTSKTVPVTFNVSSPPPPPPQPTISMNPSSLTFSATAGGSNPVSKNILVSNSGTGTLSWNATDNANWLTATQSGNSIVAAVNVAGLSAGTYNAVITVAASGATNTPQIVPVTLTVAATPPPTTGSVTLTWNANAESDLAGYKVYRATASGAYGAPIASLASGTTQYVSSGLAVGTYFFVVTAFDQSGNESSPSSEVSKSIY